MSPLGGRGRVEDWKGIGRIDLTSGVDLGAEWQQETDLPTFICISC